MDPILYLWTCCFYTATVGYWLSGLESLWSPLICFKCVPSDIQKEPGMMQKWTCWQNKAGLLAPVSRNVISTHQQEPCFNNKETGGSKHTEVRSLRNFKAAEQPLEKEAWMHHTVKRGHPRHTACVSLDLITFPLSCSCAWKRCIPLRGWWQTASHLQVSNAKLSGCDLAVTQITHDD